MINMINTIIFKADTCTQSRISEYQEFKNTDIFQKIWNPDV